MRITLNNTDIIRRGVNIPHSLGWQLASSQVLLEAVENAEQMQLLPREIAECGHIEQKPSSIPVSYQGPFSKRDQVLRI